MAIVLNGTTGITNDGGYTGDGVVFADTTPANTLVTTTGGNVGIGTSSPGFKLDVNGQARLGGSTGLTFGVGTAFAGGQAEIYSTSTTPMGLGTTGSASLQFYTGSSERARIDSSGNLLVGTTSATAGAGNGGIIYGGADAGIIYLTRSSGTDMFRFYVNGSLVGRVTTTSSATSYVTSSDYRLKENVQPMQGALAKVAELKPVTYTWKIDGADGQGFIAHELQTVVPDAVVGEKDAVDAEGNPQYQGIDTSFLVATLTAAIQELKAINDAQAQTITALTARVTALENQP